MIEIDGSYGEGGGQILRTSVALSALTGKAVRISNIRAGRSNPGLRPQHLTGIEAVAELCSADVEGSTVGSYEIVFTPGKVEAGEHSFDVGTAGSVTLVLQALLPVAFSAPGPVALDVTGGTDVKWSPSIDYFQHVFCSFLERIGCEVRVEVFARGFYPKGGGRVRVEVRPWSGRKRIELLEPGEVEKVDVWSTATEHLRKAEVAERQVKGFLKEVSPHHQVDKIHRVYVDSASIGSGFHAHAHRGNTVLGVCVLGEKSLKAEEVGRKAAEELLAELKSGAPLDKHMADQMIPYLALAGGEVKGSEVTGHAKTNAWACNQFGYEIEIEGNKIRSRS